MAYRVKTYTLREEAAENGTRYFISFKDGQGGNHELEVSEQFFIEFRQMERKNRNLLQSDERHKEFFELSDEALNKRARVTPKGVDELIIEQECSELLTVPLPLCQRYKGSDSCSIMSTIIITTKSGHWNIVPLLRWINLLL